MESVSDNIIHLKSKNDFEYTKAPRLALAPGYVLIEVKASGIGPYDLYHCNGLFSLISGMTHVPGCEGSGIVKQIGENVDTKWLNKNVAFFINYNDVNARGGWSDHAVAQAFWLMEIDQVNPNWEQGAYAIANPFTALGMHYDLLKGRKCVIQDSSSGNLGTMVTKLCVRNGIEIINICRKAENIDFLVSAGSKNNFSSDSKTFLQDLKKTIDELKPDLYLTYTGGNFPSKVFDLLPHGSQMTVLGNMSGEDLDGYSSVDFIFQDKFITGWSIFNFEKRFDGGIRRLLDELKEMYAKGDNTYDSIIWKEFKISDLKDALKHYADNMSKGKIILKP